MKCIVVVIILSTALGLHAQSTELNIDTCMSLFKGWSSDNPKGLSLKTLASRTSTMSKCYDLSEVEKKAPSGTYKEGSFIFLYVEVTYYHLMFDRLTDYVTRHGYGPAYFLEEDKSLR